ncbi:uncharacterized protein LOC8285007 [Ricinus communis]|uniref:Uncharacterized protein n=1 Tax=Ricinus communis TaxID=3988 RepID=B9RWA4_RICCO|nr:uncharacterized protein LOC8285007 [Ricinus communis]EEF44541.1 conserved hypothetical protein [Ricinus communis]|eukprot:XP_002518023.1 uncharacterized protein LOC8285007 [Ricinus communis]
MKPSTILRSLSLRIPARLSASPAVVPLPPRSPFDQQVTAELDTLLARESPNLSDHDLTTSFSWLFHALGASITTQKIALESLASVIYRDSDRKAMDQYLNDNAKMLDACNELSDKLEIVQEYVKSLRVVSHMLEGNSEPISSIIVRAKQVLDACKRKCDQTINKCSTSSSSGWLRKLVFRNDASSLSLGSGDTGEILNGSKAAALMACGILEMALSFKSSSTLKHTILQSQPVWNSCSTSMLSSELQEAVNVLARNLRDEVKCIKQMKKVRAAADELKRSCEKLEDGVKPLQERVKELYQHLIAVRMVVLGVLSQA